MSGNHHAAPARMLFVFLNNEYCWGYIGATYHLGAGYVRAYLGECGIETRQFLCGEPVPLDQLALRIVEQAAPIVGFTCYDFNYYLNKLLALRIKALRPATTIVFGGPTATFCDRLILSDCPAVDICVRGEGEHTARELVEVLEQHGDPGSVRGITYRRQGLVHRTEDRPQARLADRDRELDVFPSPYLTGAIPPSEGDVVGVLTSRGCNRFCTYCDFAAMSRYVVRYHSIARVTGELRCIAAATLHPRGPLQIYDDAFSMRIDRAKAVSRWIIENGLHRRFYFLSATRADCVDQELITLMAQCRMGLVMGVESAVPRVLALARKVRPVAPAGDLFQQEARYLERLRNWVELARKAGVAPIVVSIILGLPGEALEDGLASVEFVRKLRVTEYAHNLLRIYEGTELARTHNDFGIGIDPSPQILPFRTRHSYDVAAVPALDNAVHVRRIKEQKTALVASLVGAPEQLPGGATVLDTQAVNSPPGVYGRALFVRRRAGLLAPGLPRLAAKTVCARLCRFQVPATSFSYLSGEEDVLPYGNSGHEGWVRDPDPLRRVPLSGAGRFFASTQTPAGTIVVLTLDKEADWSEFEQVLHRMESDGDVALPSAVLRYQVFLDGECRWGTMPCPAAGLHNIFIEGGPYVRTCHGGPVVLPLELPVEPARIREALHRQQDQQAGLRQCDDCPASENCSRCQFPGMLSPERYFNLRRRYRRPDALARALALTREFRAVLGKRGVLAEVLAEAPEIRVTLSSLAAGKGPVAEMITAGRRAWVRVPNPPRWYSLGAGAASAARLMLRGDPAAETARQLQARLRCSAEQAAKAVEQTTAVLFPERERDDRQESRS